MVVEQIQSGARRVGKVAGDVEKGLDALSGLIVEARHGLATFFGGIRDLKETSQRLESMEKSFQERFDNIERAQNNLVQTIRGKEDGSGEATLHSD